MTAAPPYPNTPDHPRAERAADGVEVVDVVGIGFGPSNLALAVALAEHNAAVPPGERLSYRFVERQERFGWHRGMLLEDATMQISYLKDLVTLRNPTSPFTFLSYLHDRERLVDFLTYGRRFPPRLEFHDYLEWAAERFAGVVDYGAEVTEVTEVVPAEGGGADGAVELAEVVGFHGDSGPVRIRARNVVLATGLTPNV